jgi:ubiquinone/menaquinone biosynthesis C-methylase UbiE
MKDNFSVQAKGYSQFRPGYPEEMVNYILQFVEERNSALDVATGNGQLAAKLSGHFNNVHATDISSSQLDNAVVKDNIYYSRQSAENTDFEDSSFNLITVGQAIHWFDFEQFYKEIKRIGKPRSIIAVLGYGLFKSNPGTEKIISRFYHDIVGPYWDNERRYIDENYNTIPFPFEEIYTDKAFANHLMWTFEQLEGYLETWSAVQHYIKKNGHNPLHLIKDELQESWEKGDKQVVFPLLLRMGKIK